MIAQALMLVAFLALSACLLSWGFLGAGRKWAWLPWAVSFLPLVAVAFAVASVAIDEFS